MDDSAYISYGDSYSHYQGYRDNDRGNYQSWKGGGRGGGGYGYKSQKWNNGYQGGGGGGYG